MEDFNRVPSSIFVGNIAYGSNKGEIWEALRLVGPLESFRYKVEKNSQHPKGYGFCQFRDPDVAASALRNLKSYTLNKRQIKVDFATDDKNGTNLKQKDVIYRDSGEIVNKEGQILEPSRNSREEMLESLTNTQKTMLIFAIKDLVKNMQKSPEQMEKLIDMLTEEESLFKYLQDFQSVAQSESASRQTYLN